MVCSLLKDTSVTNGTWCSYPLVHGTPLCLTLMSHKCLTYRIVARPILVVDNDPSPPRESGSTNNYGAIIAEVRASGMMPGFKTVHVMELSNKLKGLLTVFFLCGISSLSLAVSQIHSQWTKF